VTAAGPATRTIRFRILGAVEFFDGRHWHAIGPAKQRTLLAVLLLNANRVVSAERLIAALWPDRTPTRVRGVLTGYAWRLRKVLGDPGGEVLTTRSTGYQLLLPPGALDVELYEERAAVARARLVAGDPTGAVRAFDEALAFFRDTPYADVPALPLVVAQRTRLEESRMSMLETRTAVELTLGRHEALLPRLTELVAQHPLRERFCAHLMLALYRCLNQADALAVYRNLHSRMVDELGIEPSAQLRDLQQLMLRGDARLMEPASAVGLTVTWPSAGDAGGVPDVTDRRRHPAVPLPPDPRAALDPGQVAAVTELLLGPGRVCVIGGLAGAGKTALALRAGHRVAARFPAGTGYLDLLAGEGGPVSPPAAGSLLVLDNVSSPDELRPLLPLPPGAALLVVGRCALRAVDGPVHVRLGPLSAAAAVELLRQALGPARLAGEPAAVRSIVQACEQLALPLRICAYWLAARQSWRLADVAARLGEPAGCLDLLAYEDLSVRASLADGVRLLQRWPDPGAETLLALLGALDLPVVTVRTVSALTGRTEAGARGGAERLVDAGLLETLGFDRYRVPRLLRLFLAERASPPADSAAAVGRVVEHHTDLLRQKLSARPHTPAGTAELAAWYRAERDVLRPLAARTADQPLLELLDQLHRIVRPAARVAS